MISNRERAIEQDHDCHADTEEGHCNHPSHSEDRDTYGD